MAGRVLVGGQPVAKAGALVAEDADITLKAQCGRVLTVEENVAQGGFGGAVLELFSDRGLMGLTVKRLAIPDMFMEHGAPDLLRAKYGLDAAGILQGALTLLDQPAQPKNVVWGSFS